MVGVILATLPLGLGIALNPIAIVASILVVRTVNARRNGLVFAIGWITGLALLVILPALFIRDHADALRNLGAHVPDLIWIALGVLLVIAAALSWRKRSRPGEQPSPSRWKDVIAGGSALRTLGLGVFLSTFSLKNLALLAAAVTVIGQAALGVVEVALAIAAFVAISSLGILMPPLVHSFGGAGAEARLEAWSEWLSRQMPTITAVVLAVLGMYLLGRGILDIV